MLSNVYLHEVLDRWFHEVVQRHLRGRSFLVRFADDAVLAFSARHDAERVLRVLPKRFAKYGLTVHQAKTWLLRFQPPGGAAGEHREGSLSFLGFTHYWARSRKGNWVVRRKTAGDRFSRALRAVTAWCKRYRHVPLKVQQAVLRRKLLGHYGYYGLTGNSRSLGRYYWEVLLSWRKWLSRRGGPASHLGQLWPPTEALPSAQAACAPLHLRSEVCDLRNRVRQSRSHGSVGAWGR